jgi:hypothetical protein
MPAITPTILLHSWKTEAGEQSKVACTGQTRRISITENDKMFGEVTGGVKDFVNPTVLIQNDAIALIQGRSAPMTLSMQNHFECMALRDCLSF